MAPEGPAPAPDTVAASAEALGLTEVSESPTSGLAEVSGAPGTSESGSAAADSGAPGALDGQANQATPAAPTAPTAPAASEPGPRRWPPRRPERGK
jgi:hypothetical protein